MKFQKLTSEALDKCSDLQEKANDKQKMELAQLRLEIAALIGCVSNVMMAEKVFEKTMVECQQVHLAQNCKNRAEEIEKDVNQNGVGVSTMYS
jgi:hypothetical protein